MTKPTLWQKLNSASAPRKCQHGIVYEWNDKEGKSSSCPLPAMFRTKIYLKLQVKRSTLKEDFKYHHVCANHTYL